MKSSTTKSFRNRLLALPLEIRSLAFKNFRLWLRDPRYPSIPFKKVGRFWSARIGSDYRALAVATDKRTEGFWIGPHDEYDRILKGV